MSDETIMGKLNFIIEVLKDLQQRQKSMESRQVEIKKEVDQEQQGSFATRDK